MGSRSQPNRRGPSSPRTNRDDESGGRPGSISDDNNAWPFHHKRYDEAPPPPAKLARAHGPSFYGRDSAACDQDCPVAKLAGSSATMVAYIQYTPRGFTSLLEAAARLEEPPTRHGGILSRPTDTNDQQGHPVSEHDRVICRDQISDNRR